MLFSQVTNNLLSAHLPITKHLKIVFSHESLSISKLIRILLIVMILTSSARVGNTQSYHSLYYKQYGCVHQLPLACLVTLETKKKYLRTTKIRMYNIPYLHLLCTFYAVNGSIFKIYFFPHFLVTYIPVQFEILQSRA